MGGGEEIVETIHDLREPEHRVLRAEGTVATWQVPVMVTGEWWGFVGIDLCTERPWTARDEAVVRDLVDALVGIRRRAAGGRGRAAARRSVPFHRRGAAPRSRTSTRSTTARRRSTSARRSRRCWATRRRSGATIPGCGRGRCIPTIALGRWRRTPATTRRASPSSLEYRMFAKDGRVVWVHDAARVVCDDRGMPRYSHGVMIDISERKRTEEEVAFRGVSRRAHRAPVARDVRRAAGPVRLPGPAPRRARWRCSASI